MIPATCLFLLLASQAPLKVISLRGIDDSCLPCDDSERVGVLR